MPKVLHVIHSAEPKFGGTSVSVPGLMLATANTGRYANCLVQFGEESKEELIGPATALRTLKRTQAEVLRETILRGELSDAIGNADLVHIHGLWEAHCITAGVIARRQHKPFMVSAHGMLERWAVRNKSWKKRPYSFFVERPNLRRASVLRALTLAEAEDYRRFGLPNPIALIPNGVHAMEPASPEAFLSCWPALRGRRIVLFLGRIHYKKGIDLLVKAWAGLASSFPDAHLVIAGPDFEDTQPVVERMVRELSIGGSVTFTGPVYGDRKASLLSAASLFVLPSHSEGFSVAVLEALASGVPVIITPGCNFPAVSESGCGWVIHPDIAAIEGSLREALGSDPDELKRRGRRGIELVTTTYAWPHIGEQMADVYDWMLGGSRPTNVEVWE
jgi:glycosyltransferase involved in cell wall biosynthesis